MAIRYNSLANTIVTAITPLTWPKGSGRIGHDCSGNDGIDNGADLIQFFCRYKNNFLPVSTSSSATNSTKNSLTDFLPDALQQASPARQTDFLAGRFCAETALNTLGITAQTIAIGEKGHPVFPAGIHGSISHSHPLATAVVCDANVYQGIGTDIEKIISPSLMQDIKAVVLSPEEYPWLAHPDYAENEIFTCIFSAKECFFKAVFLQVNAYLDFDVASVFAIDTDKKTIQLRVTKTINSKLPKGKIFTANYQFIEDDFIISLLVF